MSEKLRPSEVTREEVEAASKLIEEVLLENDKLKKQNNKLALQIKTLEKNDRSSCHEDKKRKSKGKKTTESGCITASEIINRQIEHFKDMPNSLDWYSDPISRELHHRCSDGSEWTRFDSDSYGSGPLKDSS